MVRISVHAGLICLMVVMAGCQQNSAPVVAPLATDAGQNSAVTQAEQKPHESLPESNGILHSPVGEPRILFDRFSLAGWKVSKFGGDGDVAVIEGEIDFGSGSPLTGISWNGEDIPVDNYRISLEAKRTAGIDFFCCLTFPVRQSHCSLVVGGWSGTVVGLSCIDGQDASSNDTTQLIAFDDDRWYKIEVAVGGDSIQAWIDGKSVLEQSVTGHIFEVRNEVRLSRPLGICTFETEARIRNISIHSTSRMESGN